MHILYITTCNISSIVFLFLVNKRNQTTRKHSYYKTKRKVEPQLFKEAVQLETTLIDTDCMNEKHIWYVIEH